MRFKRSDAKAYAQENMRGVWAAAMTPFRPNDLAIDEAGFRRNLAHWVDDLGVDGVFVAGKQGEFFSMSLEERKRTFEIAQETIGDRAGTIMSCSDQNMETVIALARHAQAVGAPYIVAHAPVLHFLDAQEQTLLKYYETIAAEVDIGIAMWSHPDSGYLMSPELCARIAERVPNIVAIKYSVPREMYVRLTEMTRGSLIVSTASEREWLDNILELGWRLYLCSAPPYLLQTRTDRRMRQYTDLAFAGDAKGAKAVSASLEPVRHALRATRPKEKPQAQQKYWQELMGQVGGAVRRPMLPLTDGERAAIKAAFETCGLGSVDTRTASASAA